MRKQNEPALLLATAGNDLGLVPAKRARKEAKKVANETGQPVTVRNPTTDKVVATEKPDDLSIPPALDRIKGKSNEQIDAERAELIARDKKRDEAQRRLLSKTHKPQETKMHTQTQTETTKRTSKPSKVTKAKAVKKQAKANGNGKTKAKAKVAHRSEGPSGKVAEILKLASRANGASRAELIELTGWAVQPWKWGFENPQGYGWCQRHGYKFKIIERKDGTKAYHVTKK